MRPPDFMWPPSSPRSATCSGSCRCAIAADAPGDRKDESAIAAVPASLHRFVVVGSALACRPKRDAMEQPRSDKTSSYAAPNGDAAFDGLVVKYTPRLYGLVYNMTSNHEDTTICSRTFFQA